jgi:hypothetical protein
MKIRMPSPAMVVALIALVLASTGTAVAAVTYARNAGAVDGQSAVSAGSSLARAKGRLVATARGGTNAGRIPGKFLGDVSRAEAFGRSIEVTDNAAGAAVPVVGAGETNGLATVAVACGDQSPAAGVENPATTVTITNTSGVVVNAARRVGVTAVQVSAFAAGTVDQFVINGSQTFEVHLQGKGVNVIVEGAVRQDGLNSGGASCLAFGTVDLVR